jgi:membrane protein implicated in regulation of membrane protease activity
MSGRVYSLAGSRNPIVQVLTLIVAGFALIVAALMGAVILAVVFGLAMIAAIVLVVRVWWLRRKLRRAGPQGNAVIETEYRVVHERRVREPDGRDG